jgi:hypothetical protein
MLIIQEIKTFWTKASRGAPGAIGRNSVPESLLVPLNKANVRPMDRIIEHIVHYSEYEGFANPWESVYTYKISESLRFGCVNLLLGEQYAEVIWRYDPGYIGAPGRDGPPKKVFSLHPGTWGQVRYNGRLQEEGSWIYQKIVLNVGNVERPSSSIFTDTPPDYTYDQMAKLL